jgi:DNA-binding transcriptional ArsR family regulator
MFSTWIYHERVMSSKRATASLGTALGDGLRLELLRRLREGPASVADLVAATGSSQPNVSNHLSVLRRRGLVIAERRGRQRRYRLGEPAVAQLVEAIAALSEPRARRPLSSSPLAEARTCYDHLAGRLGVGLLEALVERRALRTPTADGSIGLGPQANDVFRRLGVDPTSLAGGRRRPAFACLDWTERRAHLGGALGGAVANSLLDRGWVTRRRGTRAVTLTPRGSRGVRRVLGISTRRGS